LEPAKQNSELVDDSAEIESFIKRNLIVTAAPGMQLATERSDLLDQSSFDHCMNIFAAKLQFSTLDLSVDLHQRISYCCCFIIIHDTCCRKHLDMSNAASDVLFVKPPIKLDRRGEVERTLRKRFLEAASPQALFRHRM